MDNFHLFFPRWNDWKLFNREKETLTKLLIIFPFAFTYWDVANFMWETIQGSFKLVCLNIYYYKNILCGSCWLSTFPFKVRQYVYWRWLLTEDDSALKVTQQITFLGLVAYKSVAYKKCLSYWWQWGSYIKVNNF